MAWLIAIAVLALPFVLAACFRHPAARIALALFWTGSACGGAWFLNEARKAKNDLEAVQTYVLPAGPGTHRIAITPPSQKSMKGVLTGGEGVLPPEDLKRLNWRFLEPFVPATWFEPNHHDEPGAGETLLFYVDWGKQDGPLTLEYKVEPATSALLHQRSLLVRHDDSARHMIQGHLLPMLRLIGWALLVWGGLWMIVQVFREIGRRRAPLQGGPLRPS